MCECISAISDNIIEFFFERMRIINNFELELELGRENEERNFVQ